MSDCVFVSVLSMDDSILLQSSYSWVNSIVSSLHVTSTITVILTCNADMCLAAFGGSSRAPGHALAPVIFRTKQLLNLLTCNFNAGFSYHQTCGRNSRTESFECTIWELDSSWRGLLQMTNESHIHVSQVSHSSQVSQGLFTVSFHWRYAFMLV